MPTNDIDSRSALCRAGRALLVAAFLLVISLPLAANLAGFDGADPGAENRGLAPFPRVDQSWRSLGELPASFGLWFDDHFGFRSTLIRWYGATRLFVFGVSPSASVVKGRDGWFFYADDMGIEDYANVEPMTPEEVANWRAAVVRARDWLAARGVSLRLRDRARQACDLRGGDAVDAGADR